MSSWKGGRDVIMKLARKQDGSTDFASASTPSSELLLSAAIHEFTVPTDVSEMRENGDSLENNIGTGPGVSVCACAEVVSFVAQPVAGDVDGEGW